MVEPDYGVEIEVLPAADQEHRDLNLASVHQARAPKRYVVDVRLPFEGVARSLAHSLEVLRPNSAPFIGIVLTGRGAQVHSEHVRRPAVPAEGVGGPAGAIASRMQSLVP